MGDDCDNDCDLELLNALLEDTDQDSKESKSEINNSLKDVEIDFLSNETNIKDSSKSNILKDSSKPNVRKDSPKKADSSDDEDKDFFDKKQYSNSGEEIKQLLKCTQSETSNQSFPKAKADTSSTNIMKKPITSNQVKSTLTPKNDKTISAVKDVYSDPIFGYAINKPLISSAELVNLMEGRKPVPISKLKQYLSNGKPSEDWVVAGVLIYKVPAKKTSKGDSYTIWKLGDMTMNMNTVSVFLFKNAYQTMWKVAEGTVIGILNANVMESRDNKDLATIGVDNPAKMIILGTSRDMGTCKSKKKNGEQCTTIVNLRLCEYCTFHVKQEYSKHSRRPDIQSTFNGKGVTMSGTKKNDFKNSSNNKYMNYDYNVNTVPSKRSSAMIMRDKDRLEQLMTNKMPTTDKTCSSEFSESQIKKDCFPLKMSSSPKASIKTTDTPKTILSIAATTSKGASRFHMKQLTSSPNVSKVSNNENIAKKSPLMTPTNSNQFDLNNLSSSVPKLGIGSINGEIDLSSPFPNRRINIAKRNALEWVRQNGSIKPSNPNKVHESKELQAKYSAKRKRVESSEDKINEDKESFREKFIKLMETKSSHEELIEKATNEKEDSYFNKMEIKEKMEQKMLSTFEVSCKAVQCSVCKYTAFSAADRCKEERHPIKVYNAIKRFYKCGNCGNRTITLDRIPSTSCKKCNDFSWAKTTMMDEKKTQIKTANLSIRGDEEKSYGNVGNSNLNLLVPE